MKRKPGLAETIAAAGVVLLLIWCTVPAAAKSPKRHSSGRALPAMPKITKPVLFNTPEADRILQALRLNLE